jgi:hypothetical protein
MFAIVAAPYPGGRAIRDGEGAICGGRRHDFRTIQEFAAVENGETSFWRPLTVR